MTAAGFDVPPSESGTRSVLVASLGGTWAVVPEVLGFTNPREVPIYASCGAVTELEERRDAAGVRAVTDVWVVTTCGRPAEEAWRRLEAWAKVAGLPMRWRRFRVRGLVDIDSTEDAAVMADAIHRVVWWAARMVGSQRVVVSLAGGRKTMSADLQRAARFFGHGGLVHVLDRGGRQLPAFEPQDLSVPLAPEIAACIETVVVEGPRSGSDALDDVQVVEALERIAGPLPDATDCLLPRRTDFVHEVDEVDRRAHALVANYVLQLGQGDPAINFRALYGLPAKVVRSLRETAIGADPRNRERDLAWIRRLPKAELHCHLGGVLDAAGIVDVARSVAADVDRCRPGHPSFDRDLARVEASVQAGDLEALRTMVEAWADAAGRSWAKALRRRWPEVPEPLGVCGFAGCFADAPQLLDDLIFGPYTDPRRYHGIGIEAYEALGDLQGSGTLQCRETLRATMAKVRETMVRENLTYLEVRCSPENYTRGGLSGREVMEILIDEAKRAPAGRTMRFLVIASRHGDPDRVRRHVGLVQALREDPERAEWIVGFDLAGAEHRGRAAEFRETFRDLHQQIVRMTIHAGETQPVRSVWEAVYDLSADRVGHGLTLVDDDRLRARFRERRIAVELCPSSNFQIVGRDDGSGRYRDIVLGVGDRPYPAATYLDEGLRVTINTDNPGISRTCLSQEFLKLAAMMPPDRPLRRWDALQLVANGFRSSFCSESERRRHLSEAEGAIVAKLLEELPT